MSVTSRGVQLIFCEGRPESLDSQLLKRMIGSTMAQVVPCGGKQTLRSFIEGRLSSYSDSPRYVALRDRDFDAEPGTEPALLRLRGEKPIFLTYRSCVESYLLDAELIHGYWRESSEGPAWRHGDPPDSSKLRGCLETAARKIAPYQAVRWALAGIKPGERWPGVPTCWTRGSGSLPASLGFTDCLVEAKELVAAFSREAGVVTPEALERHAKAYWERFQEPCFWIEEQYLVWFDGKDLKTSTQAQEGLSISMNHFCEWAVQRLKWEDYADLREFSRKLV